MLYLYYKNKQNYFCLLRLSYRLKISFCFRNAFHLPVWVCTFFSDSLVQASTADWLALFAQRLTYSYPKETSCAWMAFQSALKLSSFFRWHSVLLFFREKGLAAMFLSQSNKDHYRNKYILGLAIFKKPYADISNTFVKSFQKASWKIKDHCQVQGPMKKQ